MRKRSENRRITLNDIAQKAGVSVSTVSRVLNNPDIVDEFTKKQVQAVLDELEYVPPMKQNGKNNNRLKTRGMIVVLVPDTDNPHYQELVRLAERNLTKLGYSMILCVFNNNMEILERCFQELLVRNIDGCIISALKLPADSVWAPKFLEQIPTVSIQADIEGIDSVNTMDGEGTYDIIEHLVKLGHKKIGFVGYSQNVSAFERRFNAYKKIHKDYNLPFREEYVGYVKTDLQSGYQEGCRLLSLPDRPTAIHCFNTRVAMGVYIAIRDKKMRIPEDVSLSAFDEVPITQLFTPPLSVVSQPLEVMVSTAVELLLKRMNGEKDMPFQNVVFPTTFIQRLSIGPAKDIDEKE